MNTKNIGIIGGGLSGLTAAHSLLQSKNKLNVTIIEKKNRIGGRILTKKFEDCYIELGAQFFIEDGEVHQIIKKLNLKHIVKLSEENFFSFYDGQDIKTRKDLLNSNINDDNKVKELEKLLNKAKNFSVCKELISCSFEEWYKKNIGESTLTFCNRVLMSIGFRDAKSINACFGLTLINALFIRNNYLLKEGLSEFINKLSKEITKSGGKIITNADCIMIKKPEKEFNIKIEKNGKIIEKTFDAIISTIKPEDLINIFNIDMISTLKNIKGHPLKMYVIKTDEKLWGKTWGLVIYKKDCPIYLICDWKNISNTKIEAPILCICSSNIKKNQITSELKKLFDKNKCNFSIIYEKNWEVGLHQPDEKFFIIRKKIHENLPDNFYLAGDWTALPALEGAVISGLKASKNLMVKIN